MIAVLDATTVTIRPTILEASFEASISSDSHWTANLSKIGMTRISREVVIKAR